MSNTIFITANWTTGALSQQTISRQYDNNRYAVQFIGYPEGDGTEELDLYLLVWMSTAPGQKPGEITPIQLNSDQWYIGNYFTQQVQVIKFQLCVLNEAGTYEAHSPIFSGRIGDSLEHDGTSQDIDVSTLFDAYREYIEELVIGAGAVIIDPTPTQGSSNAVSSGGVYDKISSTSFFEQKMSVAMAEIIPNVVPILEMGDMTINSSGWTYNDGTARAKQRVRTAKGYSIPLKRGDKVGLTDYTDARYYLGWRLPDESYGSHGWYTADTTIAYDGDYVILLAHATEVDQTDVAELGALLFVNKSGGEYNPLSVVQRSSGNNILKTTTWVDGYVTASGIHAPTAQLEITTDFITIDDTTEYKFRLSHARYTDGAENTPWIGIAIYDANRTYLRRPTVSTPINVDNDKEYFEYTLIPNSGEKYIRISFRSFGSYSAELVTINDGVAWYGYDVTEPKDLQNGRYLTMKGVNHRGWGEYPENTLIAYKQSALHGFNYVETDVRYTSDGVPVLLHDASINRTARNADGSVVSETINISAITYEQALTYDFGIYKGTSFAGTKIAKFEDFILLCKQLALHPYIELKTGMTNAQIINLVDIVRGYGMLDSVTWIAYATGWFNIITTRHARSRIGVLMTSTTQATIDAAKAYRTGKNSVFIDTSAYDASAVALAKTNGIPMEAWTLDEDEDIKALDPYITGVTSNFKIAGKVIYDGLTV